MITKEIKQQLLGIERVLHELYRDKARLDWLSEHRRCFAALLSGNAINPPSLREAIDAAMKEEP